MVLSGIMGPRKEGKLSSTGQHREKQESYRYVCNSDHVAANDAIDIQEDDLRGHVRPNQKNVMHRYVYIKYRTCWDILIYIPIGKS